MDLSGEDGFHSGCQVLGSLYIPRSHRKKNSRDVTELIGLNIQKHFESLKGGSLTIFSNDDYPNDEFEEFFFVMDPLKQKLIN